MPRTIGLPTETAVDQIVLAALVLDVLQIVDVKWFGFSHGFFHHRFFLHKTNRVCFRNRVRSNGLRGFFYDCCRIRNNLFIKLLMIEIHQIVLEKPS